MRKEKSPVQSSEWVGHIDTGPYQEQRDMPEIKMSKMGEWEAIKTDWDYRHGSCVGCPPTTRARIFARTLILTWSKMEKWWRK